MLMPFSVRRPKFKYAAFVSYRHLPEDRRWAEWLIGALQSFATPSELVAKGMAPQIGELFRDDKEMAAQADLAGYLKQALWNLEHLIVVCSAETPQSDWVRAEIALFKHWGRSGKIHALLIDPDPRRALPAELRYWRIAGKGPAAVMELTEPAAASVVPVKGKSEAELKALARDKLAAALLGCELNTLREALAKRHEAETAYSYFEQMVSRRGVPEGVGEVPEAHVAHRNATLRFESRGGRVMRISRVNGSASLQDDPDGIAQWDMSYRADGTIETIELSNRAGRIRSREAYNRDATIVDFTNEAETAAAQGMAAGLGAFVETKPGRPGGKSEVVRHLLKYDDNGLVTQRIYARDQFNTPAEDALGASGECYVRDLRGLITRKAFLARDGSMYVLPGGVAAIVESFDTRCRVTDQSTFGAGGEPALDKDGVARSAFGYDQFGNQIKVAFIGIDGEPVLDKQGYTRSALAYDGCGNLIEATYFGIDDKPVLRKSGFARFTCSYDTCGNRSRQPISAWAASR